MYYQQSIPLLVKEFKTNLTSGLTEKAAARRLASLGLNSLPTKPAPPLIFKFIDQFSNILVIILLAASAISLFLGDKLDAIAIAAIVFINALIGFIQEFQAEKTLESLKEKDVRSTLVLRDTSIQQIDTTRIVPGDILILEEGTKVAADSRIFESFSLCVDESILTGESLPATKHAQNIRKVVPLADQINMIFRDTRIIAGRAKAIVVATGKLSEVGKIAEFLEEKDTQKTPLTAELDKVGNTLTLVIGIIAAAVFFLNFSTQKAFVESLLIAISLAVAAIPEGLPAIVTIVLSLGVKRLALKKTIVKKLPAVETLGAIRIIATDKTGTLTQNKINVVEIMQVDGKRFFIEGIGYNPRGIFLNEKKKIIDPASFPSLELLLRAGVLSSNASLHRTTDSGQDSVEIVGDTTEGSLLVAATRADLSVDEIRTSTPKLFEVPFTSERKMVSILTQIDETRDHILYAKGAPEVILHKCFLTEAQKEQFSAYTRQLAKKGLRSLALCYKKLSEKEVKGALEEEKIEESGFTFLGLVGMQDPLRPEVKQAIAQASAAGIKTIMITGDHKETARTIATQAGIYTNGDILTEDEVQSLTREQLADKIQKGITVFARISPMGKLKIIEAIKLLPHTQVAVTGDGVNDAPALKSAHIGIAMGITGTDITKEVADMVITDDNYATIVDAIREGRIIFANLVKFTRYLISCNISEVIVVAAGALLGGLPPLIPIQILWINLITDGFPALALGVDPPEFDVMKRPPRDLSKGILHKKRWFYMVVEGSIMGATTLALFLYASLFLDFAHAQTMAFATLAFSQLTHAFNNRSTRKSLFEIGFFGNKPLIIAAALSVFLQVLITQSAWGNLIFKTTYLGWDDWLLVSLFSLIPFAVVEAKKQLRFRILP